MQPSQFSESECIDAIKESVKGSLGDFDLDIQKNLRLSKSKNVWDVKFLTPPKGATDFSLILCGPAFYISGFSCSFKLPDTSLFRFGFALETSGFLPDIFTYKVYGEVFHSRADNTRIHIDVEMVGYSIVELVSTKRDLFISEVEKSKHCDVAIPGQLDAQSASEEEKKQLLNLTKESIEKVKDVLDKMPKLAENLQAVKL